MANPSPQHNPTDGLNVAAYVQVTGTNITNRASGGLTVATEAVANDTTGLNGQGYGAVASTNHPVAQYSLTLSLGAKTYGGTAYAKTCQLTAVLKDVANTTYSPVGSAVYVSYNDPAVDGDGDTAAWYNPSNFAGYDPSVASVSSSGLITGLAVGQAIIEVQFPTFDNTNSSPAAGGTYPANTPGLSSNADGGTPMQFNPNMMIYCQIVVTVVA
jgi:hypothetical protein